MIYAERMYYNVRGRYGIVLNAEVLTPVPGYQGLVRLKANVLQQLNETNFQASGAAVTSSRLGVPRYWLQAENVEFRDLQTEPPSIRFTGAGGHRPGDRRTRRSTTSTWLTSRNNFLFLGGVPVFYWPVMATNLEKPSFFVDGIRVRNDSIFGFQVLHRPGHVSAAGHPRSAGGHQVDPLAGLPQRARLRAGHARPLRPVRRS